jgi:hypothetical protein
MTLATVCAALFAGVVAIGATVAIEKLGGKLGGLLGSLPTTIVPASIGFWYTVTEPKAFEDALFAVPVGMVVNAIFLYSWRIIPPQLPISGLHRKLFSMAAISLLIWACCAMVMVKGMEVFPERMFWVALTATLSIILFGLWACHGNPPAPKGIHRVSVLMLLCRGVFAALAIGFSVWIAGLGVPLLAGMAAVFPAIFITTMLSVSLSQGEAVQAGAVGPMMLGSASVSVYAILAAVIIPRTSLWGSGLAWVLSVCIISIPAWRWLRES